MDTNMTIALSDQLDREVRLSLKNLFNAARGMALLSALVIFGVMLWLIVDVYAVSAIGAIFALASLLMLMQCVVDAAHNVLWLLTSD